MDDINKRLSDWFTPWRFVLMLVIGLTAAFPRVVFGLESFFYRDFGVLGYPLIFHQHESFWRGELPLWNPLSNCGTPLLAQWGTMTLYPGSLIYLVFPLPWSLNFFCLAHLVLAGAGMFMLARRWTDNGFGAAIAGFAFVFNGVTFSCLLWPNYLVALGWMPWLVMLAREALLRQGHGGRPLLLLAGVVAAMQILSGVPELVVLTWSVVAGLMLLDVVEKRVRPLKAILGNFAIIAIATGLTAAQMLPFLDLLGFSHREPGFAGDKWAMPGWGWASLIVPLFHCFETPQGIFFQDGQAFFSSYYPGIIVLVLAVWAGWFKRGGLVLLLATLTLVAWVLALGDNGYVYAWLKQIIPGMGLARYPVKFMLLAAFTVPLLAAFALQWWLEPPRKGPRGGWLTPAISLAVVCCLTGLIILHAVLVPFPYDQPNVTKSNALWRLVFLAGGLAVLSGLTYCRRQDTAIMVAGALPVLLFFDILTHAPTQNPSLPTGNFAPGMWALANQTATLTYPAGRVMITPGAEQKLTHSSVQDFEKNWLGKRLGLWSNLNLLEQMAKVNGASTLQVREQKRLEDMIYKQGAAYGNGLLDFLGVQYITKPGTVVEWSKRNTALPLFTLGQKVEFLPVTEMPSRLLSAGFDPRAEVFLDEALRGKAQASEWVNARILASQHAFHRHELTIETSTPTLLVVAQSFYPCWKAYVDEKPATILRANYAFQAVEIPQGRHQVLLRYEDRRFQVGTWISLASLALVGFLFFKFNRTDK